MRDYATDPPPPSPRRPRPAASRLSRLLGLLIRRPAAPRIRAFALKALERLRRQRADIRDLRADLRAARERMAQAERRRAAMAQENRRLEAEAAELTETLARSETRAAALARRLHEIGEPEDARKRLRAEREAWGEVSLENLPAYMDTYHPEALLLTRRAEKGLRKSRYANPALVRDCLEILATQYRQHRLSERSATDRSRAKPRYRAALAELGVSESCVGPQTINTHRAAYTARLGGRSYLLDRHLKKGVGEDESTVFRLYYCWDPDSRRVVVGHLTTHLPTVRGGHTMT